MDFVKLFGPGESGVKEYSGCGFSGLVGCEFECADDKGSCEGSSFSLCFCRDKK